MLGIRQSRSSWVHGYFNSFGWGVQCICGNTTWIFSHDAGRLEAGNWRSSARTAHEGKGIHLTLYANCLHIDNWNHLNDHVVFLYKQFYSYKISSPRYFYMYINMYNKMNNACNRFSKCFTKACRSLEEVRHKTKELRY